MTLDTPHMIERYRLVLLRLVAGLFVVAGVGPETQGVEVFSRRVRGSILRVLRQSESATRRLIFAIARQLEIPVYVPRSKQAKAVRKTARSKADKTPSRTRVPQFRLIDPRVFLEELHPNRKRNARKSRRQRGGDPRLVFRFADFGAPACEAWSDPAPEISPDDPVTAKHILRRMQAMHDALNDLPKQAQRMVREIAKRRTLPPGPGRVGPIRAGLPPGHRKKPVHVVDTVLRECHWLAMQVPKPPER